MRGIVVGDIFFRLVAKTMVKEVAKKVEKATAPFQYASKAGCECIVHILQALTDLDANTTVVTIDGVVEFDLISRNAMMECILKMEDGDQIFPFVRCFYGSPSTYLWEDEMGVTQEIPQGEGGEQGDPFMPMRPGPGPELFGAERMAVSMPFWASKQHRIWPRFCLICRCLEDWGSVALPGSEWQPKGQAGPIAFTWSSNGTQKWQKRY